MTSRIETFFAALSDLDQATDHVTPDATFIAVRAETYDAVPIYGTYTGPEGCKTFFGNLRAQFDTQLFAVDQVMVSGDDEAAFGRFEHIVKDTGKTFRSHWAMKASFRGDKLCAYHFYEDTAALEEAMNQKTSSKETV